MLGAALVSRGGTLVTNSVHHITGFDYPCFNNYFIIQLPLCGLPWHKATVTISYGQELRLCYYEWELEIG